MKKFISAVAVAVMLAAPQSALALSQETGTLAVNKAANGRDSRRVTVIPQRILIQIVISATATVAAECSLDGATWFQIGTSLTASGAVGTDEPCVFVATNVSGFGSGTVNSWYRAVGD